MSCSESCQDHDQKFNNLWFLTRNISWIWCFVNVRAYEILQHFWFTVILSKKPSYLTILNLEILNTTCTLCLFNMAAIIWYCRHICVAAILHVWSPFSSITRMNDNYYKFSLKFLPRIKISTIWDKEFLTTTSFLFLSGVRPPF